MVFSDLAFFYFLFIYPQNDFQMINFNGDRLDVMKH